MTSPEPSVARVPERRGRPSTPFDTRPFLAIWEVTQACDLACVHCRACAVSSRSPDELSTSEGEALLDTLADMGVPLVVLTGGDPAQRPDLVRLVRHGAKRGLAMAVTPSGTPSTTRALLEELRDAGLARLAVSLDGPDAASHDGFRRVDGSFDETLRILREARALGLELQINTTLGPQNHERLDALSALVTELGAVLWSVFFVVPTGRADQKLLLGPRRVEALLEALAELSKRVPFDIKTTAAPHYRRVLLERHAAKGAVGLLSDVDEDGLVLGVRGINDGCGFVFVSHTGDVFPSGFLPLRTGNVRTDSLAELYREHPVFRALREHDALEGKCGACPFRRVCGGSRARAYAMTKNLHASDPLCAYEPKGWAEATTQA